MYVDFEKLIQRIPEGAKVLDLGGWERVFPRANTVVDLLPYATRKNDFPAMPERFTEESWIVADFCSADFWSGIPDKSFDFITIGHTLEDIRDPLYVCSQMIRCGKAGYIEFPSKSRECSKDSSGARFSGYDHHRWIIEPKADLSGLIFKAKLAYAHIGDYLGDRRRHLLHDYFFQFDGVFWTGSFQYVEHFAKGTRKEEEDLIFHFQHYVQTGRQRNNLLDLRANSSSPQDGKCLWVSEYELPSEYFNRTREMPPRYREYI